MLATHGCHLTKWFPLGAVCTFMLNALHIAYLCYMSFWAHPNLNLVGEGVSKIDFTTLLILLQHRVLQYFLLYIEQKVYGPLWVPLVLYSSLLIIR